MVGEHRECEWWGSIGSVSGGRSIGSVSGGGASGV